MQTRTEEENYWILIPPQIAGLDDLPSGAKLVFGRIFSLSQKNGYCWAFNEYIAKGTGLEKNTVATYVTLLHKKGLIKIIVQRNEKNTVTERKIFVGLFTPPLTEQGTSHIIPGDLPQQDINRVKDNSNNKEDTINTSLIGVSIPSPSIAEIPLPQNSKHAIVPLTDLEIWELAKEMDVPLWIVKQTDENFWRYIEQPKNRAKYKTSYRTIQTWIRFKLQKGEFQNCSETEKLQLDMQHPDKLKEAQAVFEWAREEKLVE